MKVLYISDRVNKNKVPKEKTSTKIARFAESDDGLALLFILAISLCFGIITHIVLNHIGGAFT